MGKKLIQQRRGKGSSTFRAPSFRYKGKPQYCALDSGTQEAQIHDFINCSGHSAPLSNLKYSNGEQGLLYPSDGLKVGDSISIGAEAEIKPGNVLPLKNIPEGTEIFNIENNPGDGGKFVKSSGTSARIVTKSKGKVVVLLPSSKTKEFSPGCRASIGVIAGGGRTEKPFLKAGTKFKAMKAKNKYWPKVCGTSMNAVAHPFGGSSSAIKGRPTQAPRSAPPGRKTGKIAPRRTGRKKR